MNQIQHTIAAANSGLNTVLEYDNIAIVVLMLCLIYSGVLNVFQMRDRVRREQAYREDAHDNLKLILELKDTLASLVLGITVLNERLNHTEEK